MAAGLDDIVTLDDLAVCLKLSTLSRYKHCPAGKARSIKVSRHWRLHKDGIDAWVRDGVPLT